MLKRSTRRAALISYLGPIVGLCVVLGLALIYWANRTPDSQRDATTIDGGIGTTGSREGGGSVEPDFGRTRDEVEFRNGSDASVPSARTAAAGDAIATVKAASTGRPGQTVSLRNVEIASISNDVAWVHDGNDRLAVTMPENASPVSANSRVDVDGVIEADASGGMRVRASRVHAR